MCAFPDNPCQNLKRLIVLSIIIFRFGPGFSSNLSEIRENKYPDGIGAEIFDFCLLADARNKNQTRCSWNTFILIFMITQQGWPWMNLGALYTVECPKEFSRPDLILDVNTIEQYRFMSQLYEYLYPTNSHFHITDIIEWYDNVYSEHYTLLTYEIEQRLVYFNGTLVPETEAKVSVYDSALMFGDMVFEMTRSFNKKQFKLREHIDRLYVGLRILRIPILMTPDRNGDNVMRPLRLMKICLMMMMNIV